MSSSYSKNKYKFYSINDNKSRVKKNSNNNPCSLKFQISNYKNKFNKSVKITDNESFFNQKYLMDNSNNCNKFNTSISRQKYQPTETKNKKFNQKKHQISSYYQMKHLNKSNCISYPNNLNVNEDKNLSKHNYNTSYLMTAVSSKQKESKDISDIKKQIIKLNFTDREPEKKYDYNIKNIEDIIIDKNYENDIDNEDILNDSGIDKNYESLKNDFQIMYIKNYSKMINDDMLALELQLLYEKIIELQLAYHSDFNNIYTKYKNSKKNINDIILQYKNYQKKLIKLNKFSETTEKKLNIKKLIHDEKNKNNQNSINIHNNECILWSQIFGVKHTNMDKNKIKKIIEDIFKNVIFEKYSKIKNNMTELEKKITLKLMKKFNYNLNNSTNNSNLNTLINTKNDRLNLKKNKNFEKFKMTALYNNNHSKNLKGNSIYKKKTNDKNLHKKKY